MTGGLIHSETMDSQKHGLLARMLYYNRPKFQEPVTLSEDETEQNANVITSLRTGLKVCPPMTSSTNIDRISLESSISYVVGKVKVFQAQLACAKQCIRYSNV